MPTNQLAPPDMPWLTGNVASPPNGLGPPLLNYAAPPPDASTSQGAAIAQTAANVAQALPSWPSVEEQRQMLQPLPGWQGTAVDAAKQWAEGVMMGTTAPGEAASPAEQMWDAFDAAHAKSGLAGVSHVKLFQHAPDQLEISHIQVDPEQRGQGVGNTLMGTLTDLADQHGVTLHASPASDADGSSGLDYEGLRDWYQRWGFDEPGGGDRLTRRPSSDADQQPPGDVPPPGIVAYHGSPHSFDQFDTSKIGTGEGAQAYGHGLYFAEQEPVAQQYRDQLRWKGADWNDIHTMAQNAIDRNGDRNAAADSLQSALDSTTAFYRGNVPAPQEAANEVSRQAIALLRSQEPVTGKPPVQGSMYQVNIGADPDSMLQWDQTVGQHPAALRDKLLDMGYGDTDRGADVYSHLARGPDGDVGASQRLQAAGIPGISYLDAGSRGVGTGTKNHVVFDANTIDILRKYGIAGLIAGGGAAAAGTQQQQPQPTPGS